MRPRWPVFSGLTRVGSYVIAGDKAETEEERPRADLKEPRMVRGNQTSWSPVCGCMISDTTLLPLAPVGEWVSPLSASYSDILSRRQQLARLTSMPTLFERLPTPLELGSLPRWESFRRERSC